MAAVCGADLNERNVSANGPLVTGMQAELYRRRIGAWGADRAERGGDRAALGAEGVAGKRDWLAEIRAFGIVVEQRRRVCLPALIPGCRTLQREPSHDSG